jgi:hypothetical protein
LKLNYVIVFDFLFAKRNSAPSAFSGFDTVKREVPQIIVAMLNAGIAAFSCQTSPEGYEMILPFDVKIPPVKTSIQIAKEPIELETHLESLANDDRVHLVILQQNQLLMQTQKVVL